VRFSLFVSLLLAGINGAQFLAVHLDGFGVDHDGCTCEMWSTDQMPIDNSAATDASQRAGFVKHGNYVGTGGGTTFRIDELLPAHLG
jgi:hypothetical protein